MDIPFSQSWTCLKENHNQPVILVSMDDNALFMNKFLCATSLKANPDMRNLIPIDEALDQMRKKSMNGKLGNELKSTLRNLFKEAEQFQRTIFQLFQETLELTQEWIEDIESQQIKVQYSSALEEFKYYFQSKENNIQKHNKLNELCQQIYEKQNWRNSFDKITLYDFHHTIEMKQEPIIRNKINEIELINTIQQEKWAGTMSFNYDGSLFISQSNVNIQIWQFVNGQMTKLKKLKGHQDWINGLIFSKRMNWIASCSSDKSIRCWKEQDNNNWICNKPQLQHTDSIMCIILNQCEEELVSCSQDKTIRVWKVNCIKNQIDYDYSLENKHTDIIQSISLNQSETNLVSYSADKIILLWIKQQKK